MLGWYSPTFKVSLGEDTYHDEGEFESFSDNRFNQVEAVQLDRITFRLILTVHRPLARYLKRYKPFTNYSYFCALLNAPDQYGSNP